MPKSTESFSGLTDRDRHGKSLNRWEQQQQQWRRQEESIAKRMGKRPEDTLQGGVSAYRRHKELQGMIDAAVPADVKNGVSAWEMNLRNDGRSAGQRYVQYGSSFPYPLYCPVRDANAVNLESPALMHVLTPQENDGGIDKALASTRRGGYLEQRQDDFKKHIRSKFAHVTDTGFFQVEGHPAPRLSRPPTANAPAPDPVVFIPFKPPQPGVLPGELSPVPRPLSAVVEAPAPAGPTDGPALVFSTAHLTFEAQPGEAVQATVRVDNTGSTAVFFSWAVCDPDATVTAPAVASKGMFRLSDPSSGTLLPDQATHFTFAFRSFVPGVFMQQQEFLTVPSGRDRVVVLLRGVVVDPGADPLDAHRLTAATEADARRVAARSLVTSGLGAVRENAFDTATARLVLESAQAARQAEEDAPQVLQAQRRALWEAESAAVGPFNRAVFAALLQLRHHFHEAAAAVDPEYARPSTEWDGCLRLLFEEVALARDVAVRAAVHRALVILTEAAAVSTVETQSLDELMWLMAGRNAFGNCADGIPRAAQTVRDVAENRLVFRQAGQGGKGDKAKAQPVKKVSAKQDKEATRCEDVQASPESHRSMMHASCARLFGDAVGQLISQRDAMRRSVEEVSRVPLTATLAHHLSTSAPLPNIDMEPLVDPNAKPKKK